MSTRTATVRLAILSGSLAVFLLCLTPPTHAATRTHTRTRTATSTWRHDDGSDDIAYVIATRDDGLSTSGSGDETDFRAARRLRDENGEDLLYVRLEDDRYVIRDRGLIAEAKRLLEPVQAMGRRQGELGQRQSELGRRQADLGQQQARVGRLQGELGRKQGDIARRLAQRDERDAVSEDLERSQREIQVEMDRLEEMQAGLSRRQEALSRQQAPLASEQEELGRKQVELSRTLRGGMERLVRDAVRSGAAESLR